MPPSEPLFANLLQEAANRRDSTNSAASALTASLPFGMSGESTSTDGLQSQLQTAITSAIQNVENAGGNSSDLETAIQAGVDKTLNANGIDPNEFEQERLSGASGTSDSSGTQLNASLRDLLAMFLASRAEFLARWACWSIRRADSSSRAAAYGCLDSLVSSSFQGLQLGFQFLDPLVQCLGLAVAGLVQPSGRRTRRPSTGPHIGPPGPGIGPP